MEEPTVDSVLDDDWLDGGWLDVVDSDDAVETVPVVGAVVVGWVAVVDVVEGTVELEVDVELEVELTSRGTVDDG